MTRLKVVAILVSMSVLCGMSPDGCMTTTLPPAIMRPAPAISSSADPNNTRNVTLRVDTSLYPETQTINWDFGDNSHANRLAAAAGAALTHSYLQSGQITVKAFLFNAANTNVGTGTLTITVTGSTPTIPPVTQPPAAPVRVKLATSRGDIVLEMRRGNAPNAVANFLQYVDDGHYNGVVFHRVVPNFVIQGGAFRSLGMGNDPRLQEVGPRAAINSEANNGLSNTRGTVAMALRGTDANSATDQFFINLVDSNTFLDTGNPPFTVFAVVVSGLDVVDQIAGVTTGTFNVVTSEQATVSFDNVPITDVVINTATRM